MLNFKFITEILTITVIGLLFLFLFSLYVPFSADEFAQYHVLSCHYYPLNMLNVFDESCTGDDLALFSNYYLPLRSYDYVGSFFCIIYYPLFKLWPSPYSVRLLGLIFLAIQALFIHKVFKVNTVISFVLLLFCMPYAFQHIVDEGVIAFHTTSVFLICYLAQKWTLSLKSNLRSNWKYPFFIGIVLFLGIWVKLAYFLILPSILILILYYILKSRTAFLPLNNYKLKKIGQQLLILLAAMGIPTLFLLNSISRDHSKYYSVITASPIIKISDFNTLIRHFCELCIFFANPLFSAHRIFKIGGLITLSGILLVLVTIAFLIFGIRQCYKKGIKYSFVIINIILFFLSFFLLVKCPKAGAMHHVVLTFPFIILAFFYIYSNFSKSKFTFLIITLFLIINFNLYWQLTKLKYQEHNHPSRLKINNLLNEQYSNKYVFIVTHWGMYYLKALYGSKDQCVIYIEPFYTLDQVRLVKEILNRTKRKALFIGMINSKSNLSLIKTHFTNTVQLKTDFDTGEWRIWYQP